MGAWTNHKATSIPAKRVNRRNISTPRKDSELETGTIAAKALELRHQRAAIDAAQILAKALVGSGVPITESVTITMSGTSTNPPAVNDVISVAVTLKAKQSDETEATVEALL